MICPPKNSNEWKELVAQVGEFEAYRTFIKNNNSINPNNAKELTEQSIIKSLQDNGVIHKRKNIKYNNYFVSKGREFEDRGEQEVGNYEKNLQKIKSWNEYYSPITGGIDVIEVTRFKNYSTIRINGMAMSLINNSRGYKQIEGKGEVNEELNNKLISLLNSKGISVQAYSDLYTRTGNEAIAVADILNKTIKVVTGKLRKDTLPEEAGHFFIESLGEDNPLYKRMLDLAGKSSLYETVKEKYKDEYLTDEDYLKETAGQLFAQAYIDKFENTEKKGLIDQLKSTINLIISKFKSFLNIESSEDIERLVSSVYGQSIEVFEKSTLEADKNLTKEYYQVDDSLKEFKEILKNSINKLKQKVKTYERKFNQDEYLTNLQQTLKELEENQNIEGFTRFIEQAKIDVSYAYKRYKKMLDTGKTLSLQELREIRSYVLSYDVLDEFLAQPFNDPRFRLLKASLTNAEKVLNPLGEEEYAESTITQIKEVKKIFEQEAYKNISKFLHEYGKSNPNLTPEVIDNQLKYIEGDISALTAYLDTIGDQKDTILSLVGKAIRLKKEDARFKTIDAVNRIISLVEQYEKKTGKKGLKTFEAMYEKDLEGNLTGNPIQELDSQFWKDRKFEQERLLTLNGGDLDLAEKQLKKWTVLHIEDPKYKVQYNNLKKDKDLFKLFNDLMKIFDEAKDMLPKSYNFQAMPQKRKDFTERVLADWSDLLNIVKEEAKDAFTSREEDEQQYGLVDEAGKPYNTVPIYYTRRLYDQTAYDNAIKEGKSETEADEIAKTKGAKDLNTDFASTLSHFYKMSANYSEMTSIQAEIETIKELVAERDVAKVKFFKPQINPITGEAITTKGLESNAYKLLDEYIKMQIYGQMKVEGKVVDIFGWKVDLSKVGDALNKYTALNTLAFNLFSPVSNLAVGKIARIGEGISKQYFTTKDRQKAELIYLTNLPNYLANDLGNRRPTSKLGVWGQYFDVSQKHSADIHDIKGYRKNRVLGMLGLHLGFIGMESTEHFLQYNSFLAIAQNWKLSNGKIVNLWEESEVKDGKLTFKNKDITQKEVKRFIDIAKGIGQFMDGVYNDVDKSIIQRYVLGRMAIMLRKHIVPGVNRRFKGAAEAIKGKEAMYNYRLETREEGTYVSFSKLMWKILMDLKNLQFNTIANWENLEEWEKANIRRALTEFTFIIGIAILANLLEDWEDEDKYKQFAVYEMNRVYTELRAYTNLNDALKILKSPAAAVTSIQSVSGLIGQFVQPWNWGDTYERGRRAGDLKIGVKLKDVTPILNKIDDLQDIKKQIDYLK